MRTRTLASLIAAASLVLSATAASAASSWESADVVGQGLAGPVVAADGAAILRTPNGVAASLTMVTPESGSYTYPTGVTGSGVAGHPEAFSLWVFIFFNPEECAGAICGPGDLMNDPDVIAGAFNAGGHLEGGANLNLQGFVNKDSFTFGGPNAETLGHALSLGYDLADADIHLAVAPHGGLDPALLPGSISTPVGTPASWWLAIFPPLG
ncbi:MAG: hypothetical protein L0227_09650 [Chloroflexi bacterium]|nr:hypothetical protein [Chloroflexota bacterium]